MIQLVRTKCSLCVSFALHVSYTLYIDRIVLYCHKKKKKIEIITYCATREKSNKQRRIRKRRNVMAGNVNQRAHNNNLYTNLHLDITNKMLKKRNENNLRD